MVLEIPADWMRQFSPSTFSQQETASKRPATIRWLRRRQPTLPSSAPPDSTRWRSNMGTLPIPGSKNYARRRADALANAGRGADATPVSSLADEIGEPAAARASTAGWHAFSHDRPRRRGPRRARTVLAAAGIKYPKTPRAALFSLILRQATIRLRGLSFRRRDAARILPARPLEIDTCWSGRRRFERSTRYAANFHATGLLMSLRSREPTKSFDRVMEATHASAAGQCAESRVRRLISKATTWPCRLKMTMPQHWCSLQGSHCLPQGDWRGTVEFSGKAETVLRDRCVGVAWELNTAQGFPFVALYWLGKLPKWGVRPILMSKRESAATYMPCSVGRFTDPSGNR